MKEGVLDVQALAQTLRDFARERDWEQFHSPKNLVMALSGEAGELTEHFQWLTEAQSYQPGADKLAAIAHELADIQIYLVRLADVLGVDLSEAVADKLRINRQKYPAEQVRGSARKYTEYE